MKIITRSDIFLLGFRNLRQQLLASSAMKINCEIQYIYIVTKSELKDLKLPFLVYKRKRGDMIQMFKVLNGLARIEFSLQIDDRSPVSILKKYSKTMQLNFQELIR